MRKHSENHLFWETQIELYGRGRRRSVENRKPERSNFDKVDSGTLKATKWKKGTSFGSRSSDIENMFDSDVKGGWSSNKRSQNYRVGAKILGVNNGFRRGSTAYGKHYGSTNKEKPAIKTEVYVPPAPLIGKALLEDRMKKCHRTGIHFEAYENIPVEMSGKHLIRDKVKTFNDLKLDPLVLGNVIKAGYKMPTPIQKVASPYISARIDIMACAQTGSGKTAAYLLPIISKLRHSNYSRVCSQGPACLILAPTRELALQIQTEANLYSTGTGLKNCCICGGVAVFHQKLQLKKDCKILVATPGRLLQFLEEGILNLASVKYFVLDEADRMLDLGFMGVVKEILKYLPPKSHRISAMFSATFPGGVQRAASQFLIEHTFIAIGTVGAACQNVQQVVYKVDRNDKTDQLLQVLKEVEVEGKVIVFCGKKSNSFHLANALSNFGFKVTTLNGDMVQRERELALKEFSEGQYQVLVTTGIASRGLDVPNVSLVINYDLPETIEEYVQRIGRTGRIGNAGKSISFFEDVLDEPLRPKLLEVLRHAEQEVPDSLSQDCDLEEMCTYGYKYTATTDYRKNQDFAWQSVPGAIELEDDGW